MGRVSYEEKMKLYYSLYEQLYKAPAACTAELSRRTVICRNTVSKYLNEMYDQGILIPPFLSLKSIHPYAEYVSLLNFDNIHSLTPRLKTFPAMVEGIRCALDWNYLSVTTHPLDFRCLTHFRSQLFQGRKEQIITPRCSLSEATALESPPSLPLRTPPTHHTIPWNEDEWSLYMLFRSDINTSITPLLKKTPIRYDTYLSWKKTLPAFTTTHVLFYPHGYGAYTHWYFLIETVYDLSEMFEQWPASCILTDLGKYILLQIPVYTPLQVQKMLQILDILQDNSFIRLCYHGVALTCL